jgi:hypothetical protein
MTAKHRRTRRRTRHWTCLTFEEDTRLDWTYDAVDWMRR